MPKASSQKRKTNRFKNAFWNRPKVLAARTSVGANILFSLLIPTITLVTLEWVARGTLAGNSGNNGFFQALSAHFYSFFFAWLLLVCVYVFLSQLTGLHALATAVTGLLGNLPAVVTYYKLTMRGEPFLPWDLSQIKDLMSIGGEVSFSVQPSMVVTLLLFILLTVLAGFVRVPRRTDGRRFFAPQLAAAVVSLGGGVALMLAIFLSPNGTAAIKIHEDMWMQDRYYRTNGVLTGFLTNLQMLKIAEPEGYSQETVENIVAETSQNAKKEKPYYENAPAAQAPDEMTQTPDIIYVMAESFWDVTALEGIEYDRDLLPNLTALAKEGGSGQVYTPSFGGGTCDVEFEALTGFSVEHLPAGCKPYQQYVTEELPSLPNHLKTLGYDTLAIHGYGRRFWNRDMAYPRLGIDEFIAEDDFVDPDRRRGFISDDAMVDEIISQYEQHTQDGEPVFIHAITMQNHTTYSRDRYPAGELVQVTESPDTLSDNTIGQLEDCATGIYEMDAALGKLTDYLRTVDRPTILVFWGDHLNPMSDGYKLFEETGFIQPGDTADPKLHETPLLIWSNYAQSEVDLGVVAAYELSPVVMDLYGMDKPVIFEFLAQQLNVMRARSRGVTIAEDGGGSTEMTGTQLQSFNEHGILQYDLMFGRRYSEELGKSG